ncbi:SHOCT domain-containing protein [Cellulosimicrobium cellulans]|uniref:SHOCT domain-containing protein n=1 Tax=Cellulosimicrobium cellulans TaxID=1710 RepID=UPI0019630911|nr:SHOCT domain-containing protein [Cellulosimicrobium cellulans]MBN0038765.1 SHOCT domain-containing protein [Cellulosimicrobium cellulans]
MDTFWDWFWLMVWWFFFVMYLVVLFQIVADLFRDRHLSGWWKAVWVIALIVVPFLSALIYLIARGKGMGERHAQSVASAQAATDAYIRSAAGASPSSQIADAKALLDAGAIDQQEFAALKAKALA